MPVNRLRPDRCPGALRPWPAEDGLLVRLRLCGGSLEATSLAALVAVAETFGDGRIHVTGRANLQVRAMPSVPGHDDLPAEVLSALEGTGLLPSRTHDLARNIMLSPQSGLAGGQADLRPVAKALDAALCADPALAHLPGRFLFVLDDGRGDLLDRSCDLGLVALDERTAQLRIGASWGPVVPLDESHLQVLDLARRFLAVRGDGPDAPWHVEELAEPLLEPQTQHPGVPAATAPLPFGRVDGGFHHAVPDRGLDRAAVEELCAAATELVVTPWRGVLVPEETR